ncbi:MAG: hypothetical protein F6K17_30310 [Okeania sp. SIO3C4]|nr:hypothetical protein [Okeania sp. SIO3C4]
MWKEPIALPAPSQNSCTIDRQNINPITITLGFFDMSIPGGRRSLFPLHLKTLVQ